MKKKYKKSTRSEKSTKKVQNLEMVKKKYSTFKKVRCGNTVLNFLVMTKIYKVFQFGGKIGKFP